MEDQVNYAVDRERSRQLKLTNAMLLTHLSLNALLDSIVGVFLGPHKSQVSYTRRSRWSPKDQHAPRSKLSTASASASRRKSRTLRPSHTGISLISAGTPTLSRCTRHQVQTGVPSPG